MTAGEAQRRTLAPFGRRLAQVTARRDVGPYVLLRAADPGGPLPRPGQFAMLAAGERWGGGDDDRPFLPRAFSVLRAEPGALEFLVDDVGPGTARLRELREGDDLWVTGPLGLGFLAPEGGRRALLVAGGVGVPPIAFWAAELRERGVPATGLLGFRDAAHAAAAELVPGAQVATDDGSAGRAALVTHLLVEALDADDHATVYACGPPAMLEAVRGLCVGRGVPGQLALEAAMACGFGACFGCVVPLRDGGYARTCVDGPVMDADVLLEVPAH